MFSMVWTVKKKRANHYCKVLSVFLSREGLLRLFDYRVKLKSSHLSIRSLGFLCNEGMKDVHKVQDARG